MLVAGFGFVAIGDVRRVYGHKTNLFCHHRFNDLGENADWGKPYFLIAWDSIS